MPLRRAALFTACACLLAGIGPAVADGTQFKMPSGNIGCDYESEPKDTLSCLRYEPSVMGIFLDRNGASAGVPDMWGPALVGEGVWVLENGQSLELGGITCTSEETGLTCEGYGHGFTVSRSKVDTY